MITSLGFAFVCAASGAADPRGAATASAMTRTADGFMCSSELQFAFRGGPHYSLSPGSAAKESSMTTDVLKRNHVTVSGQGTQPMLFAHGFGCDQNMWRYVTPAFEQDYRIVLFDYVGAGKSDLRAWDPKRYGSLNGYADDVLDVCHALELTNVIFVGHSVSSMVGVLASNREPGRFASLIMIGPSPRYINDAPDYVGGFERPDIEGLLDTMDKNYVGWANYLAPVIMKNPERPELAEELEDSFCSTDPKL